MLLVEAVLLHNSQSLADWAKAYHDLPNLQLKVEVTDRTVIETEDQERRCKKPAGLQDEIDTLVSLYPNARAFVRSVIIVPPMLISTLLCRPSGTENVVRVYAESATADATKALAHRVADVVSA